MYWGKQGRRGWTRETANRYVVQTTSLDVIRGRRFNPECKTCQVVRGGNFNDYSQATCISALHYTDQGIFRLDASSVKAQHMRCTCPPAQYKAAYHHLRHQLFRATVHCFRRQLNARGLLTSPRQAAKIRGSRSSRSRRRSPSCLLDPSLARRSAGTWTPDITCAPHNGDRR